MIELGVNIDHVATLRQARRTYEPDPVWAAVEAHLGGADGITVHLREDRRHIQDEDVRRLRELVHIKLNLEMAATDEMVEHRLRAASPRWRCWCPRAAQEITTEGGLDVAAQEAQLQGRGRAARRRRHRHVSVFIDAELRAGRGGGAHRRARLRDPHRARTRTPSTRRAAMPRARRCVAELDEDPRRPARRSATLGMRFNAGHALNYFNVQPVAALPGVRELHIGHAIVSRAVFVGMREAVREMKALMREAAARGANDGVALPRGPVVRRRRGARRSTTPIASACCIRSVGGVILFARNYAIAGAACAR